MGGFPLVHKDSNLERLHQKQQCYHYTIDQLFFIAGANITHKFTFTNIKIKNIKKNIFPLQYSFKPFSLQYNNTLLINMNQPSFKKWNTITGWCLFAIAFIVYSLTVEPSLSFWDCGEYISTSAKLQIGHPPGAPLFQMAGAVFALFATGPEKIALMVNMVSVLSSAFTILFMFWSLTIVLKIGRAHV